MQNFTVKVKDSIVDSFNGMKRVGQITTEDESDVGEAPKRVEELEDHDYDKDYKDKFLKETEPQKSKDKSEDHDYKGPIEVTLEKSPEPLETQKDREKELKRSNLIKGQTEPIFEPEDEDCPYCSGEWNEDVKMEYGDSGEVECPHCGELVVAGERQAALINVYNEQGDRLFARKASKDRWILMDKKGMDYERGTPSEIEKAIDEGITAGRYKTKGRKAQVEQEVEKLETLGEALDNNTFKYRSFINEFNVGIYFADNYVEIYKDNRIIETIDHTAVEDMGGVTANRKAQLSVPRRGQLSETDPMQMTTGAPTSEIEKYKMTRKKVDEPINVIMTPSIERKDGPGTPIDPTYLAETIVRGLRYNHYHSAQEGFNHIIRATKDITSDQIEKLKVLMLELGYDVTEQKGDIVKTG